MSELVNAAVGSNTFGMGSATPTLTPTPMSHSYLQPSVPDDGGQVPSGLNEDLLGPGLGNDVSPYGISVPPPIGTTVSDYDLDAPSPLEMADGTEDVSGASESAADDDFDCCESLQNVCEAAQAIFECIQYMSS